MVAAAIIVLPPCAASAQEAWVRIAADTDGAQLELELNSAVVEDGLAVAWQRRIGVGDARAPHGHRYRSQILRQAYDCKSGRATTLAVDYTDAHGHRVERSDGRSGAQPVPASGALHDMRTAVCEVAFAQAVPSVLDGDWRLFSRSADRQVITRVDFNTLQAVGPDLIRVQTRDDYGAVQVLDGTPFIMTLQTSLFDCRARAITPQSVSFLLSATRKVAERALQGAAAAPIPVAATEDADAFDQVCAAPRGRP